MASAQFRDALRQIHRLFSVGTVAGLSDASLLGRFAAGRDEEAFAALVARHGPMVLSVCQGLLRDPRDVEDAFQATFLVLVRRAGSVWVDDSLGGWLHRVAYRVALQARGDAAASAGQGASGHGDGRDRGAGPGRRNAPAPELHEEIARSPESYRRAVVLCYLEGMTQVQAARELRCGEATLRRRLAGARERLRTRLERRGLGSAFTLPETPAAVPTGWVEAATRAAVAAASGRPRRARPSAGSRPWSWRVMTRARRLRARRGRCSGSRRLDLGVRRPRRAGDRPRSPNARRRTSRPRRPTSPAPARPGRTGST